MTADGRVSTGAASQQPSRLTTPLGDYLQLRPAAGRGVEISSGAAPSWSSMARSRRTEPSGAARGCCHRQTPQQLSDVRRSGILQTRGAQRQRSRRAMASYRQWPRAPGTAPNRRLPGRASSRPGVVAATVTCRPVVAQALAMTAGSPSDDRALRQQSIKRGPCAERPPRRGRGHSRVTMACRQAGIVANNTLRSCLGGIDRHRGERESNSSMVRSSVGRRIDISS